MTSLRLMCANRLILRILRPANVRSIKTISAEKQGKTVTVEGHTNDSERKAKLLPYSDPHRACPLCRLNIDNLRYTDVLILEQFMRPDGTVLPRQISGICGKQQMIVERLVQQAHWAGLFSHHKPPTYNNTEATTGYKQFNRYFENHWDMYQLKRKIIPGSFYFIKRY